MTRESKAAKAARLKREARNARARERYAARKLEAARAAAEAERKRQARNRKRREQRAAREQARRLAELHEAQKRERRNARRRLLRQIAKRRPIVEQRLATFEKKRQGRYGVGGEAKTAYERWYEAKAEVRETLGLEAWNAMIAQIGAALDLPETGSWSIESYRTS